MWLAAAVALFSASLRRFDESVLLGYYVSMNQYTEELEKDEHLTAAMHEICNLLATKHDPDFIYDFFGCLFTKSELKDFAMRWVLVREIDKGTTQREIARKYGMSLCKITRGSRELKKPDSAFRRMLDIADGKTDIADGAPR